jgi:hypothetical protein
MGKSSHPQLRARHSLVRRRLHTRPRASPRGAGRRWDRTEDAVVGGWRMRRLASGAEAGAQRGGGRAMAGSLGDQHNPLG